LPAFDLGAARRRAGAVGKAIVFARHDVVAGGTRAWLDDESVRDVPRPGLRSAAGRPVCTVLADGPDAAACHRAHGRRADAVHAALAGWEVRGPASPSRTPASP
jgi:predicted ATP-grasp superfamily ATP-dependent carboligase